MSSLGHSRMNLFFFLFFVLFKSDEFVFFFSKFVFFFLFLLSLANLFIF